jgi:hypothetical protein
MLNEILEQNFSKCASLDGGMLHFLNKEQLSIIMWAINPMNPRQGQLLKYDSDWDVSSALIYLVYHFHEKQLYQYYWYCQGFISFIIAIGWEYKIIYSISFGRIYLNICGSSDCTYWLSEKTKDSYIGYTPKTSDKLINIHRRRDELIVRWNKICIPSLNTSNYQSN